MINLDLANGNVLACSFILLSDGKSKLPNTTFSFPLFGWGKVHGAEVEGGEVVEVVEVVKVDTSLFIFRKFSKVSKIHGNIENTSDLKNVLERISVVSHFGGIDELKKKTRNKKLPKKTVSLTQFSGKFSEHFRVFETRNLSEFITETKMYREFRSENFGFGPLFSRNSTGLRNC